MAEKNSVLVYSDNYTNFSQPGRLRVKDPTTFPNKEYLISKIKGVLKCCKDDGPKTTICSHEGKELSIEELVEQYYQSPEDYFDLQEQDQAEKTTVAAATADSSYYTNLQEGLNRVVSQQNSCRCCCCCC
jgi:hypothetical protein